MPKFKQGDSVAWGHKLGALHGEGSVLKKSAIDATHAVEEDVSYGVVTGVANQEQTWFSVALEGDVERVLTADELVLVAPEE